MLKDIRDYEALIREMEREMQRLADQAFAGLMRLSEGPDRFWYPRADVYETADHILVLVEIAGLDRDHYTIELSGDQSTLLLKGSRLEMPSDRRGRLRCHQIEIYFGAFERTVTLPEGIPIDREAIEATYHQGILRILLPRLDAPLRRRIEEPKKRGIEESRNR